MQASWLTPGIKVCQVALRFGANDVGSILIEENVVSAAGCHNQTSEGKLRRTIHEAGFIPAQRDHLYRYLFLRYEPRKPVATQAPANLKVLAN